MKIPEDPIQFKVYRTKVDGYQNGKLTIIHHEVKPDGSIELIADRTILSKLRLSKFEKNIFISRPGYGINMYLFRLIPNQESSLKILYSVVIDKRDFHSLPSGWEGMNLESCFRMRAMEQYIKLSNKAINYLNEKVKELEQLQV